MNATTLAYKKLQESLNLKPKPSKEKWSEEEIYLLVFYQLSFGEEYKTQRKLCAFIATKINRSPGAIRIKMERLNRVVQEKLECAT